MIESYVAYRLHSINAIQYIFHWKKTVILYNCIYKPLMIRQLLNFTSLTGKKSKLIEWFSLPCPSSSLSDHQQQHSFLSFFFHKIIYLFNLFLAVLGLRCGMRASHCGGFYCCGARALGTQASVVVAHGLSSCGSWALECRLSSCGTWA